MNGRGLRMATGDSVSCIPRTDLEFRRDPAVDYELPLPRDRMAGGFGSGRPGCRVGVRETGP